MAEKVQIEAINKVIEEYFKTNNDIDKVLAKNLMPNFIKAGVFEKDHRQGLPIRKILRELDEAKQLQLIPSVMPERKNVNTNWYFIRK